MGNRRLIDYLLDAQRKELARIREHAAKILARRIDPIFTDHTIAHSDRIISQLDKLLADWCEHELAEDGERLRAEIFILVAAVYLHDIGMQFTRFDDSPSVTQFLPSLVAELERRGLRRDPEVGAFTREELDFARRHHHLITYDWITHANLAPERELVPFERLDLVSHVEHVARVAWSHNVWLTNDNSYRGYEAQLANKHEQAGELRLGRLAAFMRMGDILDLDRRRVDIESLRATPIPRNSMAHWWRHHFVSTARLGRQRTDWGTPLHLNFTLPAAQFDSPPWLREALYEATAKEVAAEQERLRKWLGPMAVWVDIPRFEDCEFRQDLSGEIFPMPEAALDAFHKTWPTAAGDASRAEIQNALEAGSLDGELLGKHLRMLGIRTEIDAYLAQVGDRGAEDFRDRPYTPLELDSEGPDDALDQLQDLIRERHPVPRPIVLVGDPGGGKTTLVRRYVLSCARGERTPEYLPIYVEASLYGKDAAWTNRMHERLGSPHNPASDGEYAVVLEELVNELFALAARTICERARLPPRHEHELVGYLEQVIARKNCLLVLDGINEAPPLKRDLAILAVRSFINEYDAHRVVITSRRGDYHERYFPTTRSIGVKPLRESAIREYWSAIGIAKDAQDQVFAARGGPLAELAANPMHMFMLGEVMKSGEADRIEHTGRLFDEFMRESLRCWHRGDAAPLVSATEMRGLLSEVAFHALAQQSVSFSNIQLRLGMDSWWRALTPERQAELSADGEWSEALRDALIDRMLATGLVHRHGGPDALGFRFLHHTSQEYFASVAITSKIDELPSIVTQAVFHEPIRIVPGIIRDPNDFLRRLLASTSKGFGRDMLLPLCFRVAGAIPGRVDDGVLRELFADLIPLLGAIVILHTPFGADVLAHLFVEVGWNELGRFLAIAAKNSELLAGIRAFASAQLADVLTRDDHPTVTAIYELFAAAIPKAVRADHERCRQLLERFAVESGGNLDRAPLLTSGMTASIALSPREKMSIMAAAGRITPNQLGRLELNFLEAAIGIAIVISAAGNYASAFTEYYTHRSMLLLHEGDRLHRQGETVAAIDAHLGACRS